MRLLEFSVGVSLDGETLSPDEIAQLLESSGGLIPLKGKWVEVDREKLKEALTHWKTVEKDVRREGISFFRRDAPPLRGEPRQGGRGRERGGDPRMDGPDRRRGAGFGPRRACVLRRPGRRRPLPT